VTYKNFHPQFKNFTFDLLRSAEQEGAVIGPTNTFAAEIILPELVDFWGQIALDYDKGVLGQENILRLNNGSIVRVFAYDTHPDRFHGQNFDCALMHETSDYQLDRQTSILIRSCLNDLDNYHTMYS